MHRWKREARDTRETEIQQDEKLAKEEHIPVADSDIAEERRLSKKLEVKTESQMQEQEQHRLLRLAMNRAQSITEQTDVLASKHGSAKGDAILKLRQDGEGLVKYSNENIAVLDRHPRSQKALKKIVGKVEEAEAAKAEVAKAVTKARELQKAFESAEKDSNKQAHQAESYKNKARTATEANRLAQTRVAFDNKRLKFAESEVGDPSLANSKSQNSNE